MSVIDNDVKEPMNSSGRKRECVHCNRPKRKNDVSAVVGEALAWAYSISLFIQHKLLFIIQMCIADDKNCAGWHVQNSVIKSEDFR